MIDRELFYFVYDRQIIIKKTPKVSKTRQVSILYFEFFFISMKAWNCLKRAGSKLSELLLVGAVGGQAPVLQF